MRSSEDVRADVVGELEWVPGLDDEGIRIAVDDGVVTMTGHVPSWTDKKRAEEAVKKVAGVQGVADELEVRLPGSLVQDETDLVKAALDALRWNYSVPHERITVTTDGGWLTLEGEVDWQYQRKAAERALQGLTGLTQVTNRVTVRPTVSPLKVRQKIEAAFQRSAQLEATSVNVKTDRGKVTLSGTVHSWTDWDEAENAAWAAPGVTDVDNLLQVRTGAAVSF